MTSPARSPDAPALAVIFAALVLSSAVNPILPVISVLAATVVLGITVGSTLVLPDASSRGRLDAGAGRARDRGGSASRSTAAVGGSQIDALVDGMTEAFTMAAAILTLTVAIALSFRRTK